MITLHKSEIPPVLAENQEAWTNDLLAIIAKGEKPTKTQANRYNQPEIKDALKRETSGKCAYCESKPLHVSFGDIEHVSPKAIDPSKAFQWTNLTLACTVCNNAKGDTEGYIDPYVDDLFAEFEFIGPMINHHLGRGRAEKTKVGLKLNRSELLERRRERIDGLMDKLERLHATVDPVAKVFLKEVILNEETADDKEYAACTRAWVSAQQAKGHL